MCYIEEKENQPVFKVKVVEKGQDDVILTGPTPKGIRLPVLPVMPTHLCLIFTLRVCVQLCGTKSWHQYPR